MTGAEWSSEELEKRIPFFFEWGARKVWDLLFYLNHARGEVNGRAVSVELSHFVTFEDFKPWARVAGMEPGACIEEDDTE
eukprot:8087186-Alexandrium_andersonii.AAC.1